MSIEARPAARAPKRERGKQRVAALLDAGAALFAERGYHTTTMTAIAQRAGASIGSLYQFFPSKEALAEALFDRFAERAAASFDRVEERAPGSSPAELADLMIGHKLGLRSDRQAAEAALSGAIANIVERRKPLGDAVRARTAVLLRSANPSLTKEEATAASVMIGQILKMVPALAADEEESGLPLVDEVRTLLALYIERVVRA
jgi:AcrR family transcriptional regulator